MGVGGKRHAPAALPPGKRLDTHCTGGWVARSGRVLKITPLLGFDLRTVWPVSPCLSLDEFTCCCGVCTGATHSAQCSVQKCVCFVAKAKLPAVLYCILQLWEPHWQHVPMFVNHTGNMFRCW
jgi:hypothetical protein